MLQIPQGAELYPGRECIHPCPEGSAETSALLQGNRSLLVLYARLSSEHTSVEGLLLLKQTATEAEARSLTHLLGELWLSSTHSTQTIWCPDDV